MLLVDTTVWVSHLREGNIGLTNSLNDGDVVCHPFIIGELACGHLRNRSEILSLPQTLPLVIQAEHEEVLPFIENNKSRCNRNNSVLVSIGKSNLTNSLILAILVL